jgi:hypothetical protein
VDEDEGLGDVHGSSVTADPLVVVMASGDLGCNSNGRAGLVVTVDGDGLFSSNASSGSAW